MCRAAARGGVARSESVARRILLWVAAGFLVLVLRCRALRPDAAASSTEAADKALYNSSSAVDHSAAKEKVCGNCRLNPCSTF